MKPIRQSFKYRASCFRGFTLVELVIAMGVFAVLAMLAYGGLRNVLDSQAYTTQQAERLARLQLVYRVLEQDMQQVVKRGIRNEYGDSLDPFMAGADADRKLEFTRGGWRNPAGQLRSTLQRVGYDVREDILIRETWEVLDRAQDTEPKEQELLDKLADMEMRFLDEQDAWHENWPPLEQVTGQGQEQEEVGLPRAIELTLDLEDWGELKWLFQVNS